MNMLAAALFILLGLGLLAYGVIVLRKGHDSHRWPSVQGQTIVSQIRLVEWEDGAAIWPEIEYEYHIPPHTFRGRGIAFGHTANLALPGEAERLVTRYPAGEPVTVHYNPTRPQEAVLEQGAGCGAYSALVIGILFIIVGMWVGAWAGIRG
jgi:hypothetical protein